MIDWRILLDDTDISSKVASFSVTCDATAYCRQLTMAVVDPTVYAGLDFLSLPDAPTVDVYAYTGTDTNPTFPDDYTKLGSFFVERPRHTESPHSSLTDEIWGRSKTALLGSPFAAKVTKTWSEDTSFYAVCEEMCDLCGITWDPAYSALDDFLIFAGTYEAENLYPIDVIIELARLAAGDAVYITTDGEDHLCIIPIDYAPSSSSLSITDDDIAQLTESVEWPDFGNRITISATGSTSGWHVTLSIPNQCLNDNGTARTKMYAQVLNQDGEPQNDIPVDWSLSRSLVTLDAATTNTQTLTISNEAQRAKSYYEVDVTFPPTTVVGVWAARDTAKATNLVASGYELDGNTIILPAELAYCDQSLIITYTAAGMALNWATAGTTPGTEKITADVGGNSDTQELYIDNPCACPPDLTLRASPSSIKIGESAQIIAYLEIAGAPVTEGRTIWMTIDSSPSRGHLAWTKNSLKAVGISNERTSTVNEVAGVTQCELEMFPDSVTSIYQSDSYGSPMVGGSNLYSSHAGKVVTLNAELPTDTDLLANYVTIGAVVNDYEGIEVGEDRVRALISTTREERTEATCRITVTDEENSDTTPEDCCNDGEDSDRNSDENTDNDDEYDWMPDTKPEPKVVHCLGADGKLITCAEGQVCCTKGGVWGCYAWNECDQVPDTCYPVNCRENPSDGCLQTRFTKALAENAAYGCSCEELCDKEFAAIGTTQNYDGASMRMVADIVVEDHGYALGTPEFWEKYEELKAEALASCREQCGDCATAEPITIEGDEAGVAPGAYGYTVTGGRAPYNYAVEGTGSSIAGDGTLTMNESACGTHTITVTDMCGVSSTKSVRTSNAGKLLYTAKEGVPQGDMTHPNAYGGMPGQIVIFPTREAADVAWQARRAECNTSGYWVTPESMGWSPTDWTWWGVPLKCNNIVEFFIFDNSGGSLVDESWVCA